MNLDARHIHPRLLVVDDEHDSVDSMCEWVGLSTEWTVVGAYGPADAIAQTQAIPPDAILLDMEMHGADGFETAERLCRASGDKHSAIVALTGSPELRDAASHDVRFTASMLKPANLNWLLGLLARLAHDDLATYRPAIPPV